MRRLVALAAVLALAGCGGSSRPKDDPAKFATQLLDLIVHNKYSTAWGDLHSKDKQVAPFAEYVHCEQSSPVIAVPTSVKVQSVNDESVAIGDGTFVESKAVDVNLGFKGGFSVEHTIHVVAEDGKWQWILPSRRYRDYKLDSCPTDAGSSPAPTTSWRPSPSPWPPICPSCCGVSPVSARRACSRSWLRVRRDAASWCYGAVRQSSSRSCRSGCSLTR